MAVPNSITRSTATPIALELSPRDLFCAFVAVEAAAIEMVQLEMDNEMLTRFNDLHHRFHKLLKDGGHV